MTQEQSTQEQSTQAQSTQGQSTEPLNLARRGGYEVWYLTWNHAATGQGFWLRYVVEAGHGELWFARFDPRAPARTFGVHRVFVGEVGGDQLPFRLVIGGGELAHDHARGELAADGHQITWDLRWPSAARALRLLPDVMYARGGLGDTTVVSPNPRVLVTGVVTLDGERLDFADAVLGQTHLWGRRHAHEWTWGRCAELVDPGTDDDAPGAVLELLGVRLERRGRILPTMALVAMELDGEPLDFHQFRHVIANRARWELGRVEFSARGVNARVTGELTCAASDAITAPYMDPDGTRVYCANTEIGDARITVARRTWRGWRERELIARGTAHFETGGRAPDPRVARMHVRVD